ncbi:DNA cytosine methyltransferase [Rhodococcus sp. 14-2483-1-2]|uniref:DNA cytosine methyltransferase n=1 Tax=Rhodococcus sp. 14-2483-1-2 TaxID=2023147 RepID=UPI0014822E12|nr:DNA cytosine methyltransferase [Rhodococcus sp. 14-2483-1-2]
MTALNLSATPGTPVHAEFRRRGASYQKSYPEATQVLVIDFFAGAGGMSCGFQSTRQSALQFNHIGAIDIDQRALDTLSLNLSIPTFNRDVRDLAADPSLLSRLMPQLATRSKDTPLVFVGCPPCQGFSAHRKKDPRNDPRNDLVAAFAKICVDHLPDLVVIENVPEMISGKYREYFDRAKSIFEGAGYKVHGEVLDLALYGVPQRRRRAVVVATRSTDAFVMPSPIQTQQEMRTVRDAIAHLPQLDSGETDTHDPWHRAPKHTPRILDRIQKIPHDGGDMRDLSEVDQLACHLEMRTSATQGFSDVYGRLRWDAPAITITAKSSTPSCGRFLHPEQDRNISVREAAILQGFPQNYMFSGPFTNQYRQIGEAVPPMFARALAYAVLNFLKPVSKTLLTVKDNINAASVRDQSVEEDARARSSKPLAIDLFCGAGGLSLGLHASGFHTALAADLDPDAVSTYRTNVGLAEVLDLREDEIVRLADNAVGDRPFIVAGGPPCQGFSQQRRGDNDDIRNELVKRHGEIALSLAQRPRAVVLENVAYLDSPRGKQSLEYYLKLMSANRFTTFRYDVNSANFGTAQTRLRLVLISIDEEFVSSFKGLKPLSSNRWPTIGEELAGLSQKPTGLRNHVASNENQLNVRRMSFVDMGKGRTAIPEEFQLNCHRNYDGHLDVFGRLDWYGQARTLTGGFDSASRGEHVHPFRNRSITAREAARLQGFPDSFLFSGTKAAVRKQIGNAVPPTLGHAIGSSLRPVLAQ